MESLQALPQVGDVYRGREKQLRMLPHALASSWEKFRAGKPSRSLPPRLATASWLACSDRSPANAGQDTHHTLLVKSKHTCSRHVHSHMHMYVCIHAQTDTGLNYDPGSRMPGSRKSSLGGNMYSPPVQDRRFHDTLCKMRAGKEKLAHT